MSTVLDIDIRRKSFGTDPPVLADLRLSMSSGEFVALVGPSGAGKTTLLKVIAGLDTDVEGEIRVAAGGVTGFMFQEPRLMPWLTSLDNVRLVLPGDIRGQRRAGELLAAVGLAGQARSYPSQLSGGMRRRVALARAFAPDPELLLMDEPFVSLDAPTAQRLRDQLMTLWQQRRPTVLFVTHDLREAIALADRILFLSSPPARIIHEEAIPLARPREPEDPAVTKLRQTLLERNPQLLHGSLESVDG